MKKILHAIIFLVFLAIDLYVMVTADLIVAIVAFIIGITFFTHYIFEFQNRIQKKNWIQGGIQFFFICNI